MKSERQLLEGTINNTARIGNNVDSLIEKSTDIQYQLNDIINNQKILDSKLNILLDLLDKKNKRN